MCYTFLSQAPADPSPCFVTCCGGRGHKFSRALLTTVVASARAHLSRAGDGSCVGIGILESIIADHRTCRYDALFKNCYTKPSRRNEKININESEHCKL